jgi:hypothetical protein
MLQVGGTAGKLERDSKSLLDEGKIETDTNRVACSGFPEALRKVAFVR